MTLPWFAAFRPSVTLAGETLVVRNRWRTCRVPLSSVEAVEPGYSGLTVVVDGRVAAVAWAVQKSNIAMGLGRSTRADRVAEHIREAARAAGAAVRPGTDRQKPGE